MRSNTIYNYIVVNKGGTIPTTTTTTTTTTTKNPYGWWNLIDQNVWGITVGDGGGYFQQYGNTVEYVNPYRDVTNKDDFIDGYSCVDVEASFADTYTKTSAFFGKDNTRDNFDLSKAWMPSKIRIAWDRTDVQCEIWIQNWNGHNLLDNDMYNHNAKVISSGDEIDLNWHTEEYVALGNYPADYQTIWWVEICPVDGYHRISFKLTQFEAYGLDPYNYIAG